MNKFREVYLTLIMALVFLGGVGMGFFTYSAVFQLFPNSLFMRIISLFMIGPVFFLFVTFIHEMGHALAAWVFNFRVHFIAIGAWGFDLENKQFIRVPDYSKHELAGFVSVSPRWPYERRFDSLLISLAGPLATFLMGLSILFVSQYLNLNYRIFIVLVIICFFDAGYNLWPISVRGGHKSDGRQILEELSSERSNRVLKNFLHNRLYAALTYKQDLATDEEWLVLRRELIAQQNSNGGDPEKSLLSAWMQTDPEAFVAMVDSGSQDIKALPKHIQYQYIVSSILIDKYDASFETFLQNEDDNDFTTLYFAKALFHYRARNHDIAVNAVKQAREAYIELSGSVPAEEEVIFSIIENQSTLPDLKWPRLHKKAAPKDGSQS